MYVCKLILNGLSIRSAKLEPYATAAAAMAAVSAQSLTENSL